MAVKKKKLEELMYKARPVVRRGNTAYYGFINDPFLVKLTVKDSEKIMDTEISSKVTVQLITNNSRLSGNERIIKSTERDGLFSALDVGTVWLEDALSFEA